MIKKMLLALILIVSVFLAGCQMVQGLGGDIKWMGDKGADVLSGGNGEN